MREVPWMTLFDAIRCQECPVLEVRMLAKGRPLIPRIAYLTNMQSVEVPLHPTSSHLASAKTQSGPAVNPLRAGNESR